MLCMDDAECVVMFRIIHYKYRFIITQTRKSEGDDADEHWLPVS